MPLIIGTSLVGNVGDGATPPAGLLTDIVQASQAWLLAGKALIGHLSDSLCTADINHTSGKYHCCCIYSVYQRGLQAHQC